MVHCDCCGREISEDAALEYEYEYYCPDCAAENLVTCTECGEVFHKENDRDSYIEHDGRIWCESCFDDNFFVCYDCEEIIPRRDSTEREDDRGNPICCDCFDANYTYCADCSEVIRNDEAYYVASGDYYVCEDCRDHYFACTECGELVDEDYVYWNDYDEPFCEYCYEHSGRSRNGVHDYGYKPEPVFSSTDFDTEKLYMGFELECDNPDNFGDFAERINDEFICRDSYSELLYCKNDGSLNNGVEIVSHPSTLKFYKAYKVFEGIKEINDDGHHFKSDMTKTCGLHVHVSRSFFGDNKETQDYNIAKLVLLIRRFWDGYIMNFSRRRGDYHWCAVNPINPIFEEDGGAEIVKKCVSSQESRYVAINCYNTATVEFRIFKGSLNPETCYATLEFVDRICRFVKDNPMEIILKCSWSDVFGKEILGEFDGLYDELISYNKRRGISEETGKANCIPILRHRNGYHYSGEVILLKPAEEIINILYGRKINGNEEDFTILTAEGLEERINKNAFTSDIENEYRVVGIGTRIGLQSIRTGIAVYLSRDTIEDIVA